MISPPSALVHIEQLFLCVNSLSALCPWDCLQLPLAVLSLYLCEIGLCLQWASTAELEPSFKKSHVSEELRGTHLQIQMRLLCANCFSYGYFRGLLGLWGLCFVCNRWTLLGIRNASICLSLWLPKLCFLDISCIQCQ